jgi:hypothetical protein
MRVRFIKGQTFYNELFVVNRGDFEMARVLVDPKTGLHDATAFDWTKGPPYSVETIASQVTLAEARKAVKDYLEPLPEPPAY